MEQFKIDTNQAAIQKILDVKSQRMSLKKEQQKIYGAIHQESRETWEANQAKAKERAMVKKRVQKKLQKKKQQVLSGMRMEDKVSVVDQIRDFEHRLSRLDKPPPLTNTTKITNGDPNAAVSDKRGMERDVAAQMNNISEKKKLTEDKSIAREKRRRRFMKGQEEAQIEGYHSLGVDMIREQLTRKTRSENQIIEKIKEISKHKAMAVENRAYRNQQYKQRAEIDGEEALKRDNAYLESNKVTMMGEVAAQEIRVNLAQVAKVSASKKRTLLIVQDTISTLIDLAVNVADFRRYANHYEYNVVDEDPAPLEVWSDMKRAYVNCAELSGDWVEGEQRKRNDDAAAGAFDDIVDASEYGEYITDTMMWDKFVYKLQQSPGGASDDNENENENEGIACALGDCIIDASLTAESLPAPPPAPEIPRFPLKIALFGCSFSGKTEQAERLADRYNCKVISVDSELQKATKLSSAVQLGNLEEPTGDNLQAEMCALGREANSTLVLGGEVGDDIYVKLAVLAVKKLAAENAALKESGDECYTGWVMEDFPQSTKQAILLEKSLSGYDYEAHVPNRHDRMSELASASPLPPPPAATIKSGIDLVLNLKNDLGTTLKRSLGRRIDPETGEKYHLETNRPPYDLVCKERLVEPFDPANATPNLSLHVLSHLSGASGAADFFAKFDNCKTIETGSLSSDGTFASINKHVEALLKVKVEEEKAAEAERARAEAERTEREAKEAKEQEEEKARSDEGKGGDGEEEGQEPADEEVEAEIVVPDEVVEDVVAPDPVMSKELGSILTARYSAFEGGYRKVLRAVFRALRSERHILFKYLHDTRETFKGMLECLDDKQVVVDEFVESFNSVSTDMRFDDATKSELCLRLEECRDALWKKVEGRMSQVSSQLEKTRNDGWVEKRTRCLQMNYGCLIQLEVDRFFHAVEIMRDSCDAGMHTTWAIKVGNVDEREEEGRLGGATGSSDQGGDAADNSGQPSKKGKGKGKAGGGKNKDAEGNGEDEAIKRSKDSQMVFDPRALSVPLGDGSGLGGEGTSVGARDDSKQGKKGKEDKSKRGKGKKGDDEEPDASEQGRDAVEACHDFAIAYAQKVRDGIAKEVEARSSSSLEPSEGEPPLGSPSSIDLEKVDISRLKSLERRVSRECSELLKRVSRAKDAYLHCASKVSGMKDAALMRIESTARERRRGELRAIEEMVRDVKDKIDGESCIDCRVELQSCEYGKQGSMRLGSPAAAVGAPKLETFREGKFNERQLESLRAAVVTLCSYQERDGTAELEDVADAIARISCDEPDAVPRRFRDGEVAFGDIYEEIEGNVHVEDRGRVRVEDVLGFLGD